MNNKATILYFAGFREQLDLDKEDIDITNIKTLDELIRFLRARGGKWDDIFNAEQQRLMSINQQMATPEKQIRPGDEIAFFPPVTGG